MRNMPPPPNEKNPNKVAVPRRSSEPSAASADVQLGGHDFRHQRVGGFARPPFARLPSTHRRPFARRRCRRCRRRRRRWPGETADVTRDGGQHAAGPCVGGAELDLRERERQQADRYRRPRPAVTTGQSEMYRYIIY